MVPFPLPLPEPKEIFPPYFLWKPHSPPGGKTQRSVNNVVAPLYLDPYGVFNSQTCPHGASSKSSTAPQVLLPWHWFLLPRVHPVSRGSLYSPVCPNLGGAVCPVSSSLLWIQKGCWFFSLFRSLFVIGMKWWLQTPYKGTWNQAWLVFWSIDGYGMLVCSGL